MADCNHLKIKFWIPWQKQWKHDFAKNIWKNIQHMKESFPLCGGMRKHCFAGVRKNCIVKKINFWWDTKRQKIKDIQIYHWTHGSCTCLWRWPFSQEAILAQPFLDSQTQTHVSPCLWRWFWWPLGCCVSSSCGITEQFTWPNAVAESLQEGPCQGIAVTERSWQGVWGKDM